MRVDLFIFSPIMAPISSTLSTSSILSSSFLTIVIILVTFAPFTIAQCPSTILPPCSCSSTLYEPVSIVCDSAPSLLVALAALGSLPTTSIDSLFITNTPIDTLPAYAFQELQIKRLVLNRNDLQLIDAQAFDGKPLTSIEELDLRNNNLAQVPVPGVSRLRSLRTLILARNKISYFAPKAFDSYQSKSSLKKLDLSGNQLSDLEPQALLGLTALEQLRIDKNFLTAVPTAALRVLSTLEDLSLGVNKLTEIQIGALDFPSLTSLSLEVNSIPAINSEVFRGVPNLAYLYLSANRFTALNPAMFQHIPKLKVLAMGSNPFKVIPSNAFYAIPGLVRLELSECLVENIEPRVFQTIPKVQVIVLNKNKLTTINRNTFEGLSELYSLDLKGNDISNIDDRSFSSLPALRHLDLSSNQLKTLQPNTFTSTLERTDPPTARVLYIYDNPWVCDERLDWFRQWLRNNMEMMIDAPGYPPTVCFKPAPVYNLNIRQPNPPESQRQPAVPVPTRKPLEPIPIIADLNDAYRPKLSGLNLAALILGIILGILLLSILLLMVVRYFVSKSRKRRKDLDEDFRRFGSSVSGYNSASGSVYPSPPLPAVETAMSVHDYHQQRRPFSMHRPLY